MQRKLLEATLPTFGVGAGIAATKARRGCRPRAAQKVPVRAGVEQGGEGRGRAGIPAPPIRPRRTGPLSLLAVRLSPAPEESLGLPAFCVVAVAGE